MNKKITTIDDLVRMIEKESQTTGKRFDALEGKIEKMVLDVKEIRTDINSIHTDIKEVRTEFKDIRADIKNVDMRTTVIGLGNRVSKLEGTV